MSDQNKVGHKVDPEILRLFHQLSTNSAKVRLNAASKLLQIISKDKEKSISDDFNYVVERLIKGTKSSKDAPKIGATVLLTEILCSFPNFPVVKLLETTKRILGDVNDELPLDGVTGWTLVFTAIVQSNRLDISDKKTLKELIRFMVQLGDKKPMCNVAICNIFEKLFDRQFETEPFAKILNSSLKLNDGGDPQPFHLYLILLIHKHPELSRVLDHIPTVDLDDPDNLVDYVKATSSHLPLVHPACIELFHHLNENGKMELFWKPVFNDTLFGLDHSIEYHRLGFALISAILPHLNENNANLIFSKQMMDLWMQCLSNGNHRLHGVAVNLGKELVAKYVDYESSLQTIIISLLTESPGTVSFDDLTHSTIVNQLYMQNKSDAVQSLVDRTIDKIREYKATSARDKMRTLFVCQLRDLLKSSHLKESTDIKLTVMKFFLAHGYFDVSNHDSLKLSTPATEGLHEKIRVLFFKILNSTCSSNAQILESMGLYVLHLIKSEVPLKDEKILSFWKKIKKQKLKFKKVKDEGDNDKQLSIFKPLIYGIALSSLQDSSDMGGLDNILEELTECFKRSLGENQQENEPKWPDVLLDMMISQFPSQSAFLSSIMIKVFRSFASDLTLEGIEQLKIALLADKLEDDEDIDDEDDGDGEDDENENAEEEKSDDDDSDENESDMDDEDGVDDEFRAKVILALGPAAEIGDESDAGVDDEEMFQLDEALSEAFRSKYPKDKNAQITLKILRSRCLDLVEIIFKAKEPSLEITIQLVPVLIDALKLYNGPKDLELRNRVCKILMQLPNVKLFKSQKEIERSCLQSIFKKAIDLASKVEILSIQKSAARVCVWTMLLSNISNLDIDWTFDLLLKLLSEFFVKSNCCVSKEFFLIIFQYEHIYNLRLLESLSENVFVDLRPFKKIGGLVLLANYLKSCKDDITKDVTTNNYLKTIRKESIAGLLNAIQAQKGHLINEYFILSYILSKFIPLDLSDEEAQKIKSINKKVRANISKVGKAAQFKILASVDKSSDQSGNQEQKKIDTKKNGEKESNEKEVKQNVTMNGDTSENSEIFNNDEIVDENTNLMKQPREKLTPKQKKRASLKQLEDSNKKKILGKRVTPLKGDKKNEEQSSPHVAHEESKTITPTKPNHTSPKKSDESKKNEEETKAADDLADAHMNREVDTATPVKSPVKKVQFNDQSPANGVNSSLDNSALFLTPKNSPTKSTRREKEPEKKDKTDENASESTPNSTPKSKGQTETPKRLNMKSDENSEEDGVVITCDFPTPTKLNDSKNNLNSSLSSNKSSSPKTPEKRALDIDQSSPSKKSSRGTTPTDLELIMRDNVHDENVSENRESSQSNLDGDEPAVKKVKVEKTSDNEESEDSNVKTPVRVTRSRAKTPRTIKTEKPIPETKEEQSEADDELPDFSIPRVKMVKTPSNRSKTRVATPTTDNNQTPLRRSLRNRK